MGRIRKIRNFECLQELHYGFGYASAFIPFLQAFKDNEIIITFAYKKTNLYTQKGILPSHQNTSIYQAHPKCFLAIHFKITIFESQNNLI